MSNLRFQHAAHDHGVDAAKLKHIAPRGTASNVPTATTTKAGTVLKAAAVPDVSAVPTVGEFNGLLASLRAAGILAT